VVTDGTATIEGGFDDETERAIVTVMARTVPGVAAVRLTAPAV
jgi:osmotically-inducible protein OsmY